MLPVRCRESTGVYLVGDIVRSDSYIRIQVVVDSKAGAASAGAEV